MRVLVVEDEARMAGLLKRALQEEGHAVDVAADGREGMWLATENALGQSCWMSYCQAWTGSVCAADCARQAAGFRCCC